MKLTKIDVFSKDGEKTDDLEKVEPGNIDDIAYMSFKTISVADTESKLQIKDADKSKKKLKIKQPAFKEEDLTKLQRSHVI